MNRPPFSVRSPFERSVVLLLVTILVFSPFMSITVPAQDVVRADATIATTCKPGEVRPPGNPVKCVAEVKFHYASIGTLDDAQNLAIRNGWVLASVEEMNVAYSELKLNTGGVAGMINDGRLALPIQGTAGPGLTRGVNIGFKGINSGFFYVQKSAAGREQAAPPPPEWSEDVLNNPLFNLRRYEMLCSAPPANPMLDGWRTGDPMTVEAGAMLLRKEGVEPDRNALSQLGNEIRTDPVRRWQYAPFMLRVMWDALAAKEPTPIQGQFRRKFEQWAACDETNIARMTLADWNRHIGKFGISLQTQQYCEQVPLQGGGTGERCQSVGVYEVPPETRYKMNTLGILFDTKTGRGTTTGFLPRENPYYIGSKGQGAMSLLYTPMMMKTLPVSGDPEYGKILGEEMSKTALGVGITAGSMGVVLSMAGGTMVRVETMIAASQISRAAEAKLVALDDVAEQLSRLKIQNAVNRGVPYDEAVKQFGVKASQEVGEEVGESAGKLAAKNLSKRIWGRTLQESLEKTAAKAGQEVGELAAKQVAAVTAKHVATKVVAAAAVIGVIATFGEILVTVVADAIKTDKYDASLNEAARTVKRFRVSEQLGTNPTEFQRAAVFTQLVKMTIADPADRGVLSLDLPTKACGPGMRNATKMECIPEVKFHNQASLSLNKAQEIASSNGWQLATEEEVGDAWLHLNLDVYAYGMMANGKIAVPVQRDYWDFQTGPNLNVAGGNAGFFYTVGKPLPPPDSGFVRFQNFESPSNYLLNQVNRLEYGPAQPNWHSAMWKLVPVHSGWVRIQNRWYPNIYLHFQNGKLEAGPIEPNWASAMWKLIPDKEMDGAVRIQNNWYQTHHIHSQGGTLQVGPVQPTWKSALWYVQGR